MLETCGFHHIVGCPASTDEASDADGPCGIGAEWDGNWARYSLVRPAPPLALFLHCRQSLTSSRFLTMAAARGPATHPTTSTKFDSGLAHASLASFQRLVSGPLGPPVRASAGGLPGRCRRRRDGRWLQSALDCTVQYCTVPVRATVVRCGGCG